VSRRIRVLVVDDSTFARSTIARRLNADPDIDVIDTARDGVAGVEKTKALRPDVVTLDVEMPVMDGIAALRHIMREVPTPVVMLSTLTGEGTLTTMRALELGAVDFFPKPSISNPVGANTGGKDFCETVRIAATVPPSGLKGMLPATGVPVRQQTAGHRRGPAGKKGRLVVIGSSTGGPKALASVIPALPGDLPAAVIIVQHMPPGFTRSLAERLDQTSDLPVREAETGDIASEGTVLLAPGDYHMRITAGRRVELTGGKPVHGVRPAVDLTMESAVRTLGRRVDGVVLTGMGVDGTAGAAAVKAAGGAVLAEHQSTCAVYGMPRSVAEAGWADKIVPIHRMAHEIVRMCETGAQVREPVAG